MVVMIMCDDMVVFIFEEEYLFFLVVVIEWLVMGEGDDRIGFVVLIFVVQFNVVVECENGYDGCKGFVMEVNEVILVIFQLIEGFGVMECERGNSIVVSWKLILLGGQ